MSVKLQVALDLMNLRRAVNIAKLAVDGGVDWIEAGTLLIKSEGMEAIRRLRKEFPDKKIFADMKTMDVGGAEVEMASKAGADIVGILGASDDETIKESLRAARNYDTEILVDLIQVPNKVERAKEVCQLGIDYLGVHVGVDTQMKGADPLEIVEEVSSISTVPIAAAGGITSEDASEIVKRGAEIIIVGGAITKSKDVTESTRKIKRAISEGISLKSDVSKKFGLENIREIFEKVSTPNISDAMHREPSMEGIIPMTIKGEKIIGKAFTVKTVDGDWAKPVEAIQAAEEGMVIVIDADAGRSAVWGELASWSCHNKGINGVVIDGALRDVDDIEELGFPVFARYRASNAGEPKGYGGLNNDIVCGGRKVRPGDWIIGDDSGVMVVPKEEAVQVANRALDVMEKENRIREEIKEGDTLSVVMELEKWEKQD